MTVALPPLSQRSRDVIDLGEQRIAEYQRRQPRRSGFVASDFEMVGRFLHYVEQQSLAPGSRFCEWGSGFGVVAALASCAGFGACGIEIQPPLVQESRQLVEDLELAVEFVEGTFLPESEDGPGGSQPLEVCDDDLEYAWWHRDSADGHEELDAAICDFDLIYCYPWPGEESLVERLFLSQASTGALFMTHHGVAGTHLRRKAEGSSELLEILIV